MNISPPIFLWNFSLTFEVEMLSILQFLLKDWYKFAYQGEQNEYLPEKLKVSANMLS